MVDVGGDGGGDDDPFVLAVVAGEAVDLDCRGAVVNSMFSPPLGVALLAVSDPVEDLGAEVVEEETWSFVVLAVTSATSASCTRTRMFVNDDMIGFPWSSPTTRKLYSDCLRSEIGTRTLNCP